MNVLAAIEGAAKTAAAWFLKAIKKAQAAAPTVQAVADRVFPWAKMVVDGVLISEGNGAITTEANLIMDEINRDIDVACATVYDVGVTPTAGSFIKALVDNIGALITAGHVKNPANVALINNVVGSLSSLTTPPTTAQ
jgi:hypothetical protein